MSRQRIQGCFEIINSVFWTAVNSLLYSTFQALKTWFELSRIKLYRNDLKGNKICSQLSIVVSVSARLELSIVLAGITSDEHLRKLSPRVFKVKRKSLKKIHLLACFPSVPRLPTLPSIPCSPCNEQKNKKKLRRRVK